ncbi:MAG TPA: hypothetical protein VLW50_02075 [Streptosporangiaceae bacterium]|nr:hypothetical protein [Streptosporangiaceae bacterium]
MPVPPPLVPLIRAHIDQHGTTADGRLFPGYYGGELSESTYGRGWEQARENHIHPRPGHLNARERPYDLRHACVSRWLKAGIEPKRVAEWATSWLTHRRDARAALAATATATLMCADGWFDLRTSAPGHPFAYAVAEATAELMALPSAWSSPVRTQQDADGRPSDDLRLPAGPAAARRGVPLSAPGQGPMGRGPGAPAWAPVWCGLIDRNNYMSRVTVHAA